MKKFGIANSLTMFRVVCVPLYILFFILGHYNVVIVLYLLGAVTDLIDGTVARLLKEHSQFGAILDPIADKVCMLTVFLSLAVKGIVPWWFIIIMLVRDGVVLTGFVYVRVNQIPFRYRALWSSKVATLVETAAGAFALVSLAYPYSTIGAYPVGEIAFGSILIASILILFATLQYLKLGMHLLEQRFDPQ